MIHTRDLRNVCLVDQTPRERIPAFICACDVCLVLLRKSELFKTVIPTKMLEFMSCARPVILGVEGQARQILEQARAGVPIEPENATALVNAIVALSNDAPSRQILGVNARKYILEHYSREETAKEYLAVLDEILRQTEAPPLS
jgi:glycosyltransferase involved in cell wall biosynthesis